MKNLLFIIAVGMACAIQAQTFSDTLSFDEVDIVTSKFNTPKSKVANKVEVMTKREISLQNFQSTADLLAGSGQVFVQKSQSGGGSPVIRGFEANKVLIVVDGVRMNNAIFRGGHLQNVIRLDNSMLDRADVVFGPGSLIYGSDALGGVLHFQTLRPKIAFEKKVEVSGGALARFATANQEKTGHFDLNIGAKKFASLTAVTFTDYGDVRQGGSKNFLAADSLFIWDRLSTVERFNGNDSIVPNHDFNVQTKTAFYQYNLLQKFMYNNLKNMEHTLSFQFTNSNNVSRYDRLTEMSGGMPKFAEWYYGPEMWAMGTYKLRMYQPTKAYDELSATLAYQYFGESRVSRKRNDVFRRTQEEKLHAITLNVDAYKVFGKHRVQYGVEGTFNLINSTANELDIKVDTIRKAATRYPDGGSQTATFSLYATDQITLKKWLLLNFGGRFNYNYLKSTFNDKTFFPFPFDNAKQSIASGAGNVGLVFLPIKGTKVSVLGSSGYRVPNVDDMSKVFESAGGNLLIPNPHIKPEYTLNGELSVQHNSKYIYVEATGFYTYLLNALTTDKTTFAGADSVLFSGSNSAVYTTVNKDKAFVAGAQAALTVRPWQHLSIYGNLTYTYGRIIAAAVNTPLDHIAPLHGRFGVKVDYSRFFVDVYGLFNGVKKLNDYRLGTEDNEQYATPVGMPAWMTFNAKMSVQVIKNLSIQGGIENILDTRYRAFASGISAPGRNFMIALRANF